VGPEAVWVHAGETRLRVLSLGSADAEPLIMLHGMRDVAWSLLPLAAELAARYRVLLPDLRGHGESDQPGIYTLDHYMFDLHRTMEALGAAPAAVFGHSLGGAAVLAAAARLDSIRAVVTIGAPATAQHIGHLLQHQSDQIRNEGEAVVTLGAREFSIKRQFLEDIDRYGSTDEIRKLDAALLVMHSPVDNVVSIDEAARIYQAAKHPKSFISLDRADHLLSRAEDAEYVATLVSAWAGRYLESEQAKEDAPRPNLLDGEVLITEQNHQFLRGMYSNSHFLRADEPRKYGGSDLGPTPYDLLLMSLGSCTSMTLRMYARRKKLPLDDIEVRLLHERVHAEDCVDCEQKIERIIRRITLRGDLDAEQRQRLLEIADRCPVHRTLESDPRIVTELVE